MSDHIHDPLAQKMGYDPSGSKRPPPPWDNEVPIPPVVNAPDQEGKYGADDLPSQVPEGSEGIHGQGGKDTH